VGGVIVIGIIKAVILVVAWLAFILDSISKSLALRRQSRQLRNLAEWMLCDLPDPGRSSEDQRITDGEMRAWSVHNQAMRRVASKIRVIAEGKPWKPWEVQP
jgi:hypothetical protein